ncbi:MAG: hypothetical protein Q9188_002071 [Gyalolechia gomerana]
MAPLIKQSAVADIRRAIDEVTTDSNRMLGCVSVAVNKDGKTLIEYASGDRGLDTQAAMTLDQSSGSHHLPCNFVEQGHLGLDNADQLEEICPELKEIRIFMNVDKYGKPESIDKKNRMTLRMLLTHTGQSLSSSLFML